MENNTISFKDAVVVTGVQRSTVPSDKLFAEKGKTVLLGVPQWNIEAVPVSVEKGCLILKKAKSGSAAFLVSLEK